MSVYPLTTPLDLRLSREIFKYGPLKWDHHHWTGGIVPQRETPRHEASSPGRTCGPDALDNLGSREYDRYRESLRQLIMPLRSRPMPMGANAGRLRARHGTVAATDVRNTLVRPPSALNGR
ncbi:hypothetical protein EVAR_90974_1 [Eumeta japonica]|uniref:Uncharacterized protein n=1 Tax=Eumeta variegata TaxID=151549 RepID=A0A4C1Z5Z8_EUMVA|nr:hypothetical protein EVAR_90974_1 [Eumeta japonica]